MRWFEGVEGLAVLALGLALSPGSSKAQEATIAGQVTLSPLRRQNPREEPGAVIPHAGICAGGAGKPASLP